MSARARKANRGNGLGPRSRFDALQCMYSDWTVALPLRRRSGPFPSSSPTFPGRGNFRPALPGAARGMVEIGGGEPPWRKGSRRAGDVEASRQTQPSSLRPRLQGAAPRKALAKPRLLHGQPGANSACRPPREGLVCQDPGGPGAVTPACGSAIVRSVAPSAAPFRGAVEHRQMLAPCRQELFPPNVRQCTPWCSQNFCRAYAPCFRQTSSSGTPIPVR